MNSEDNWNDQFKDYHFEYDKSNPFTLVLLKDIEKVGVLDSNPDHIFPNYVVLPEPKQTNMLKACISAMVKQPVAATIMISQFCSLARKYHSYGLSEIDKFELTFLD